MPLVKPVPPATLAWQAIQAIPEAKYLEMIPLVPFLNKTKKIATKWYIKIPKIPLSSILQTVWIMSHIINFVSTAIFLYKTIFWGPKAMWYYFASTSSILTYLLVTYRHATLLHGSIKKAVAANTNLVQTSVSTEIPFSSLLRSENTHLLAMAVLASVSTKSSLKLASAAIYSYMNLATFAMVDLFPDSTLTGVLLPLFNYLEDNLLVTAASIDYIVVAVYFKDLWAFKDTSFFVYILNICLRLDASQTYRDALHNGFELSYVLLKSHHLEPVVSILKNIEQFIILPPVGESTPKAKDADAESFELVTSKNGYGRDRVTSFALDIVSIENDINTEIVSPSSDGVKTLISSPNN